MKIRLYFNAITIAVFMSSLMVKFVFVNRKKLIKNEKLDSKLIESIKSKIIIKTDLIYEGTIYFDLISLIIYITIWQIIL